MGPFREIRTKKTAPRGSKDEKLRQVDLLRMKKTAPRGVRAVLMGPLREIRTKKDRATWI